MNRPASREDFIGSILSNENCGLIDKFADDCRIASCKDEDRNRINFNDSEDIEVGTICRIKCRQVKATRCRCCKEGFIVSLGIKYQKSRLLITSYFDHEG